MHAKNFELSNFVSCGDMNFDRCVKYSVDETVNQAYNVANEKKNLLMPATNWSDAVFQVDLRFLRRRHTGQKRELFDLRGQL